MAALIPLLTHLRKPTVAAQIRLDRFSPHFMEAERFGLVSVRPASAYRYVFPLEDRELARLAYFFECDYRDGRDPLEYTSALRREITRWEKAAASPPQERPRLDLYHADNVALIEDTRDCAVGPVHVLRGLK